jgi:hypothetical protein
MNKSIGVQLLVFGFILAGLSYLAYNLSPTFTRPTVVVGLGGGLLSLLWGVLALSGRRGKALPVLTLIVVGYILLGQAIQAWGLNADVPGRHAAGVLLTLLCALTVAMLIRIAYAGVSFGGTAASRPGA